MSLKAIFSSLKKKKQNAKYKKRITMIHIIIVYKKRKNISTGIKIFNAVQISVISFGTVTFVSDEHNQKACLPILVTLFGIVIFVSDEHPKKDKSKFQ